MAPSKEKASQGKAFRQGKVPRQVKTPRQARHIKGPRQGKEWLLGKARKC
jgi:hypothetical protein